MIETANSQEVRGADRLVPSTHPDAGAARGLVRRARRGRLINLYDNTNVLLWKLGDPDSPDGQYLAATDWPQVHSMDPGSLAVQSKLELPLTAGLRRGQLSPLAPGGGQAHLPAVLHVLQPHLKFDSPYRFSYFEEHELLAKVWMPLQGCVVQCFPTQAVRRDRPSTPVTIDFMAFPHPPHAPFETLKKLDDPVRFYLIDLNDGFGH